MTQVRLMLLIKKAPSDILIPLNQNPSDRKDT